MSMIPDSAPFTEEQKAWLNGFFAGLIGVEPTAPSSSLLQAAGITTDSLPIPNTADSEEEDFPWHEPELPIVERMELADGRPLNRKMMAAMAQLDCGTCGYLCETYSDAIASGTESDLTLCSPGGKETKQMLKKLMSEQGGVEVVASATQTQQETGFTRKNPFPAKLIESYNLNREGSAKATHHVVIDLTGSEMTYEVGDALGVWPTNCDELISQVIERIEIGNDTVTTPLGNTKSVAEALREDCCLKDPTDELLELLVDRTALPESKSMLQGMLDAGGPDEGVDVLDLLTIAADVKLKANELIENTESLKPRLYSIASSMKAVGNEVHLTVGKVTYQREDRLRKGVASTMFSDRLSRNEDVRVYMVPNTHGFTVPVDDKTPMIMVGPGTGIAPFIAFMQERVSRRADGKNWLFFGDQHQSTDFLYQQMLESWSEGGALNRLDTAFSRDGDAKVYVQDRMRQNGAELWQWLNEGACFYVCGDASRMASDVDKALVEICAQHGQMSDEEAKAYVKRMSDDKRYSRDVY